MILHSAKTGGGHSTSGLDSDKADNWRTRGNCHNREPEIFFPARSVYATDKAKRICNGCPVSVECFGQAIGTLAANGNPRGDGELFGVWGGLSEAELRWAREGGTLRACQDCRLPMIVRMGRKTTLCAVCRIRRGKQAPPAEPAPVNKDDRVQPRDIRDQVIAVLTRTPRPTFEAAAGELNCDPNSLKSYWRRLREGEEPEARSALMAARVACAEPKVFNDWLRIEGYKMSMVEAGKKLGVHPASISRAVRAARKRNDKRLPERYQAPRQGASLAA